MPVDTVENRIDHARFRAYPEPQDMTPEQVLEIPPRVLAQEQREFYFDNGYLLVESIIPLDVVEEMRAVTTEWVERSRSITKSDAVFDLEPGHAPDNPRLRRLSSPVEHDNRYWKYASESIVPDIIADLVGIGRQVPPLEAQLQMGRGGRGGQVAPGHPVLAAHQLQPPDDRHLSPRRGTGPGSAGGHPG